ncbi:protein FLX-like 2 [Malania oleifera]|uniref:protein FLX-like 2 n=1 Tax=Malania oleifera TaxID=397392 RepID=UPI0025ADCFBC|nr:protein FLX-like 2 [Malania oleifera]
MGSKGRIPSLHSRRPLPGLVPPEPFGPGMRPPPPGAFHSFDMPPSPEVLEQKLAAQHVEMERLVMENQRLASTHGTLRHEVAAAQHELQMLLSQIGAVKSEREQQMGSLMDKIAKMETELQAAEPTQLQLQQARADAQSLVAARQELITKVQQLTQDLQRAHSDGQQIPALVSELESLRQEYQHCRATYDYEKKLYNDHLESLQVMEKNYITMAREVEKLRAELTNSAGVERRSGGPYSNTAGYNENEASGHHPSGQNSYEDGYGVPQGRGPFTSGSGAATGGGGPGGAPAYAGVQPGSAPGRAGYDAARGPGFEAQRGSMYDGQRGSMYDQQRGAAYDAHRGVFYDGQSSGAAGPHGQGAPTNNAPYGSATPPARSGGGYDAPPRGRNPAQR